MKNFIKTRDKETANLLRQAGLEEIISGDSFFTFINSGKVNFEQVAKDNIVQTNMLMFVK